MDNHFGHRTMKEKSENNSGDAAEPSTYLILNLHVIKTKGQILQAYLNNLKWSLGNPLTSVAYAWGFLGV